MAGPPRAATVRDAFCCRFPVKPQNIMPLRYPQAILARTANLDKTGPQKEETAMTTIRRIDAGPRLSEALTCGDRLYTSGLVADETIGPSVYLQTKDIL